MFLLWGWSQIAQKDCGVSIQEDIQNPAGRGPEQPSVDHSRTFWLNDLHEFLPNSTIRWFCWYFVGCVDCFSSLGYIESALSIKFSLHVCFIDIWRKKSPAWKMGKLSSLNIYLNTAGFLNCSRDYSNGNVKQILFWKKASFFCCEIEL